MQLPLNNYKWTLIRSKNSKNGTKWHPPPIKVQYANKDLKKLRLHMVHDVNKVSSNKNVRQMNGKTKKDRTELNTLVNGLGPSWGEL